MSILRSSAAGKSSHCHFGFFLAGTSAGLYALYATLSGAGKGRITLDTPARWLPGRLPEWASVF